jgi:hypothetical protein
MIVEMSICRPNISELSLLVLKVGFTFLANAGISEISDGPLYRDVYLFEHWIRRMFAFTDFLVFRHEN